MSDTVRLSNTLPRAIHERLEHYAKINGDLTLTQALIALIVGATPRICDEPVAKPAKPVDPQKRLLELRKRLKPYIDKWEERTITRKEVEIMDKLTTEIREVKAEMGETLPVVNRVAEFDQKRQNAELLVNQMEHELDQLQAVSRARPLDPDDQYRVKELLTLIPQAKRELEINYPL